MKKLTSKDGCWFDAGHAMFSDNKEHIEGMLDRRTVFVSGFMEGCEWLAYPVSPEKLARLERRAKDWARDATEEHGQRHSFCLSCNVGILGAYGVRLHAHDCDAAIILDLERESVG